MMIQVEVIYKTRLGYLEGTSRRVSIEVYDDVDLFGDGLLQLLVNLILTIIMYP